MADKPKKHPDAGLWEYGRRFLRAVVRNRFALLTTIKVAQAIVKLITAVTEMFRNS